MDIEYLEIAAWNNYNGGKNWRISIDIGEKYVPSNKEILKNEKGLFIEFKSPMNAVNYLKKCGWKLIATQGGASGSVSLLYFIMQKECYLKH